jgi:hypothetical protein
MALVSKLKQPYGWPVAALIVADVMILAGAGAQPRYIAALVLLLFLPGWIWIDSFFSQQTDLIERLALAVGLSLALTIFGAMFAAYWPGPLTMTQILATSNALSGAGLATAWRWRQARPTAGPGLTWQMVVVAGLLLLLAAALRLPRLGYAEFHEDEAEALMLGVRLFQGEDYALFLHRKGPAQMLLPLALWLLTGQISEALARFPFALSSILSAVTLFLLGRRWFNFQAGAMAGLLWAINGYAIGFGRMVQYQALIFFLGPLAIYCLYLAWRSSQLRWQILGSSLLAACLLAHFDALLLLPAAAYLSWRIIAKDIGPLRSRVIAAGLATTLFLALLAAFYVPYFLDPEFQNTTAYLSESRVRPGFLYNNLDVLRRFDRDYSSHFYLPLLAVGLIGIIGQQGMGLAKSWRWLLAGLLVFIASTFWLPDLWQLEQFSLAGLPWLLLGLLCFRAAPGLELRAAWLMFGAALAGYVFLVSDPRTHLYILYPGAILLAGAGWSELMARPVARAIAGGGGVVLVGAALVYTVVIFLQTESSFARLRQQWDGSAWELIYDDLPQARNYFGYPKREGWKAMGALRAEGLFPGDFRSVNEDFIIPIWYNYGQARSCYDTPTHFFVRLEGLSATLPENDLYRQNGQVSREGQVRIQIFSAAAGSPQAAAIYPVETFEASFDRLATPQQFARQAIPSQLVGTQFGPAIRFAGYDLAANVAAPGETLHINLYWQALERPGENYRAFLHLTDGVHLWAQQDDDPACRLPTSIWRAGQRGIGQFRLQIDAKTPPGRYPLIMGLYQAETLQRLAITAGPGQVGDDFLWLGDIEIVAPKTQGFKQEN